MSVGVLDPSWHCACDEIISGAAKAARVKNPMRVNVEVSIDGEIGFGWRLFELYSFSVTLSFVVFELASWEGLKPVFVGLEGPVSQPPEVTAGTTK